MGFGVGFGAGLGTTLRYTLLGVFGQMDMLFIQTNSCQYGDNLMTSLT